MRRPLLPAIGVGVQNQGRPGGVSGFARPAGWKLAAIKRRWPVVAAVAAAWPVGVAAGGPVFNSADLLVWAVAGLFVYGVCRK